MTDQMRVDVSAVREAQFGPNRSWQEGFVILARMECRGGTGASSGCGPNMVAKKVGSAPSGPGHGWPPVRKTRHERAARAGQKGQS